MSSYFIVSGAPFFLFYHVYEQNKEKRLMRVIAIIIIILIFKNILLNFLYFYMIKR